MTTEGDAMGDPFASAFRHCLAGVPGWTCIFGLATWSEMCAACRNNAKAKSEIKDKTV